MGFKWYALKMHSIHADEMLKNENDSEELVEFVSTGVPYLIVQSLDEVPVGIQYELNVREPNDELDEDDLPW